MIYGFGFRFQLSLFIVSGFAFGYFRVSLLAIMVYGFGLRLDLLWFMVEGLVYSG